MQIVGFLMVWLNSLIVMINIMYEMFVNFQNCVHFTQQLKYGYMLPRLFPNFPFRFKLMVLNDCVTSCQGNTLLTKHNMAHVSLYDLVSMFRVFLKLIL